MTKVQITFKLSRSLVENDLVNIGKMHSVYGFNFVRLKAGAGELFVEYDASRLSQKEVRASLEEHGLPLTVPVAAIQPAASPEPAPAA